MMQHISTSRKVMLIILNHKNQWCCIKKRDIQNFRYIESLIIEIINIGYTMYSADMSTERKKKG